MTRPDTAWRPVPDQLHADFRYFRGLHLLVVGEDRWTWSVHRKAGAPAIWTGESVSPAFARKYAEELAQDAADLAPMGEHLAEIGGEA